MKKETGPLDFEEKLRIELAEKIWLNYFNQYLFEHGTISEREYKKMTEIIAQRYRKNRRRAGKEFCNHERI